MRDVRLIQALATLARAYKGQIPGIRQAAHRIFQTNASRALHDAGLKLLVARFNLLAAEYVISDFDLKQGKEHLPKWLTQHVIFDEEAVELMASLLAIDGQKLLKLTGEATPEVYGAYVQSRVEPYLLKTQYSHELRLRLR